MKTPQTLLLALFLGVCFASHCEATTYNSDGSAASVQGLANQCLDGDTITMPAGTFSWTTTVTITKGITLIGATTVSGDHTTAMSADDQTVILDDVPISGGAGNAVILDFTCNAGKAARISGGTFRGATRTTTPNLGGVVLRGTSNQFRVDHCHFDNLYAHNLTVLGSTYGVIDHCLFNETHFEPAAELFNGGGSYGDLSWSQPTDFGSGNFVFLEDCTFSWLGDPGTQNGCGLDSYKGGRYVARYCTFNNSKANTHGTESPGRARSVRAVEIYNNAFNWTSGYSPTGGQLRGGCLLIHDNVFQHYGSGYGLHTYREFFPFSPWGGAFGTNAWDVNDETLYASGTHTGANGVTTLTESGAAWTPNQWVGYMVLNTVTGRGSYIRSNTNDTITYYTDNSFGGGWNLVFNTGDIFEIRRIVTALDQLGRGQGDLLTGDTPINSSTGTVTWPNQALDPVYSWNNTNNGSNLNIGSYGDPGVQENRDYYNNTPKPGYTPYVYPHPLVTGYPTPTPTATTTPSATPTTTPTATGTPTATATPAPSTTPSPTPAPTATPTPMATPTPTPCLASVPNFVGAKILSAQTMWQSAGFTTKVTTNGAPGHRISSQSLPLGYQGDCSTTVIFVSD